MNPSRRAVLLSLASLAIFAVSDEGFFAMLSAQTALMGWLFWRWEK